MIKINDVKKTYLLGKTRVNALDGITLFISRGDFASIVGPSGSGKSTLLNIIGCLDRPTSGSVSLDDQDITSCSTRELTRIRGQKIGFIFQNFNLIPVLNVFENIELPLIFSGKTKPKNEILTLIKEIGLGDHIHHRPDELSGGQRQRVAIARALIIDPSIVLADEPTANLDSKTAKIILDLMKQINKERGTTFVFSTHDPDVMSYAACIHRLHDGKLRK